MSNKWLRYDTMPLVHLRFPEKFEFDFANALNPIVYELRLAVKIHLLNFYFDPAGLVNT